MASRVLDSRTMKPLQPATSLWKQYDPAAAPRAFKAETPAEAGRWQRTTRRALARLLRLDAGERVDPAPRGIEVVDKGDYLREKIVLRTGPHAQMPVYLLLPKGAQGPLPCVVAFHGHGYGVKDIVGLWEDGGERDVPDGYHKDFGVALCRAGFAVAAPEISGFGERQTDFSLPGTGAGGAFDLRPHGLPRLPPRHLGRRHPRRRTACVSSTTWRPAPSSTPAASGRWASPGAACTPSSPPASTSASAPAW